MSARYYTLDSNGTPQLVRNAMQWAAWMQSANRSVARTQISEEVFVSTVFLGLDHNHFGSGPPILWETMVFGGPMHEEMNRCSGSREQAEAMHNDMVERVQAIHALQDLV